MAQQLLVTSNIGYDPFTFAVFIAQSGPNGLEMVAAPTPPAPEVPEDSEPASVRAAHSSHHDTARHK